MTKIDAKTEDDKLEIYYMGGYANGYQAAMAKQWLPIETAPEPGIISFLVARSGEAGVPAVAQVVRIDTDTYATFAMPRFKSPTHWMPLPKPPGAV